MTTNNKAVVLHDLPTKWRREMNDQEKCSEAHILQECANQLETAIAGDELMARNKALESALMQLVGTPEDPNNGWRGIGGTDLLFACEYCGSSSEDCTAIEHLTSCPIPAARDLINQDRAEPRHDQP